MASANTYRAAARDSVYYNCGSGNSRCYALNQWSYSGYGAVVQINVVRMVCGCSGFVNNEMWVEMYNNPSCGGHSNSNCWVEGGYSDTGGGTLHYFWADNRPNGGYNGHDLNTVPTADVGGRLLVSIEKVNSNTFDVSLLTNSYNFYMQSTSNNMTGSDVSMGAELAGSGQITIPGDYFYNPYYYPYMNDKSDSFPLTVVSPSVQNSPLHMIDDSTSTFYDYAG